MSRLYTVNFGPAVKDVTDTIEIAGLRITIIDEPWQAIQQPPRKERFMSRSLIRLIVERGRVKRAARARKLGVNGPRAPLQNGG